MCDLVESLTTLKRSSILFALPTFLSFFLPSPSDFREFIRHKLPSLALRSAKKNFARWHSSWSKDQPSSVDPVDCDLRYGTSQTAFLTTTVVCV